MTLSLLVWWCMAGARGHGLCTTKSCEQPLFFYWRHMRRFEAGIGHKGLAVDLQEKRLLRANICRVGPFRKGVGVHTQSKVGSKRKAGRICKGGYGSQRVRPERKDFSIQCGQNANGCMTESEYAKGQPKLP